MRQFDRWIKSELNQYEASRPDAAWEKFADRMDHADKIQAEEHAFNQAIKEKLDPYQASYKPSHWQSLRVKLEAQAQIRAEMLRIKVLEAALFALIFITLWQLQPGSSSVQQSSLPIASIQNRMLDSDNSTSTDPALSIDNQTNQGKQLEGFSQRLNRATSTTTRLSDKTSPSDNLSLLMPRSSGMNTESSISSLSLSQDHLITQVLLIDQGKFDRLDFLPTSKLTQLVLNPEPLQIVPIEQTSLVRHRISMAINGDLNYVMTPYDQLLVNRGYDQLVSGYGGWIGYAWEGPKWALRTAIAYHRKYYLPKPYTEVFDGDFERGYFSETLRDIELNLLSLSVQGQRTFSRRNHWHSYGLIGGTGHLAFQANYDRKQSYAPGADPQGVEIPEPLVPSKTSQKKYADGFFEGGSFVENSYFTIDLGIGIERHLNERASLFFEPVYQHNPFQKSLGPNKDRINTLSLSMGVRVNL